MKNNRKAFDDIDLTGVIPTELSELEVMEITDFIENYKSLPPTNTQQIISYLLKNGKLTIEEIAECLNLPVNQIAQKQLEIQ